MKRPSSRAFALPFRTRSRIVAASISANAARIVAKNFPDAVVKSMLSSIDTSATEFTSASSAIARKSPSEPVEFREEQDVHVGVSLADRHEAGALKAEATVRAGDVEVLDDLDESPASGEA